MLYLIVVVMAVVVVLAIVIAYECGKKDGYKDGFSVGYEQGELLEKKAAIRRAAREKANRAITEKLLESACIKMFDDLMGDTELTL